MCDGKLPDDFADSFGDSFGKRIFLNSSLNDSDGSELQRSTRRDNAGVLGTLLPLFFLRKPTIFEVLVDEGVYDGAVSASGVTTVS